MKLEDVRTFKIVCITSHTIRTGNEKINELLENGWVIISNHEGANGSLLVCLGNAEFVEEETE